MIDFIVKLPKLLEPGLARLCNLILVIVNQLTKALIFVPTEETIVAEELVYKVYKALVSHYSILEQFITD
jgi:hypothetical protein